MYWALIKENKVVNVIVAKQNFIDRIKNEYDHCVDVSHLEFDRPTIGWLYEDNQFSDVPIKQAQREAALEHIRQLRDEKLKECDVMINELHLELREDKEAIKAYRQALLDITEQFKDEEGNLLPTLDEVNLEESFWPTKPEGSV